MLPHALNGLSFVERFYSLPVIESTNSFAKSLSVLPKEGIFVVQADKQTSGRGRGSNKFISDNSEGLWTTIVQPVNALSDHFTYNRALTLSICETISAFVPDAPLAIKWPNDIYWKERKCAGILLENIGGATNHLLIGFGLNVNQSSNQFDGNLQKIATSLFIESATRHSLSQILHSIIERYKTNLDDSLDIIHDRYQKILYRINEPVVINEQDGTFRGVNCDGALLLETAHSTIKIYSGTLRFLNDELRNVRT